MWASASAEDKDDEVDLLSSSPATSELEVLVDLGEGCGDSLLEASTTAAASAKVGKKFDWLASNLTSMEATCSEGEAMTRGDFSAARERRETSLRAAVWSRWTREERSTTAGVG